MHVTLFKTFKKLWPNAKKFYPHKHVFLQMLLMNFYIRWFHPQSDCGQNCLIQQITMQICIAWIFHALICNSIKGAIPIQHLASCATSLILKSKSSTITSNLVFFIRAIAIVGKKGKKNLPKWIWQQKIEVALGKTKSCKNTQQNIHLQKHRLVKEATKQSANGESLN